MTYDINFFENIIKEDYSKCVLEDTIPQDITETIHINLNDETIDKSDCSLIAYGIHVDETDDTAAYNQKNNPDKAVDIMLSYPNDNISVEIFLETESKEWNSSINNGNGRLSPEQMEQFFKSNFFNKLREKLENTWPCTKDELFSELREGLLNKKYKIDFDNIQRKEDSCQDNGEINEWEITQRKVKLGKPNERDINGKKIRSSSGRKLINFSDMGVSKKEEAYYSWPGGTDDKHVYKWSRWNNWENQKPFLRCRFGYNVAGGAAGADVIGLSLTLQEEEDKNRGFISYDLSLAPSLQYLTPEETQDILKLSIVRRFLKECLRRIEPILDIPDEELLKKINKPDKCTLEDIRKTKNVVRNTLKAVRDSRANTFIYT